MNKTKEYISPSMKVLEIEMGGSFLTGSVTDAQIKIDKVTVEPYQDGFANDGGFKDISFD